MLLRIAPILFVVLWSTGFIASKIAGEHAEPFTFLAIRFSLVTLLLAPVLLIGARPSPRAARDAAITGALIHTGYIGGVMWGLRLGMPAGVVTVIVCLQPLLTSILAGPLLGERIDLKHWIGIGLGLAGAALVVAPKMTLDPGTATLMAIGPIAVIATIGSLICITAGTLYQKVNGAIGELPKLAFFQYVGATSVAMLLAFATETRNVEWTKEFTLALAWLVVLLSIGAISLLLTMIRASAVSRVTSLFYLVPATTALMAWGLLGEHLTLIQIVGMVLVMIAVGMIGSLRRA
ncbi:MAG TPA: DMT family transporter [Hyphomicrobiaceae bacterium]|nr:DMT family transporter [Hyphomicrobiaceae bacterium]